MKKRTMFGWLAAGMVAVAAPAGAQSSIPLTLEVRGGAAFPTGDLKDVLDAEMGVSYGVNATFQATPLLGIYAGYERAELGMDDAAFGEGDLTDEGFSFGGRLSLPAGGWSGLGPWVRAGGVYNRLTRETDSVTGDFESDRGFGFELGGGLSIPLGMVVAVTPGVRYRSYSPNTSGLIGDEPNVSYFVADLGLSFRF